MAVPKPLHSVLGKREIKRSLGTGDYATARKMVVLERLKAQAEIDAAWRRLKATLGEPSVRKDVSDGELWGLMSRWFVSRERDAQSLTARDVDVQQRLEDISWLSDPGDGTSALASVHSATQNLLAAENIDLDQSSATFRKLEGMVHEALLEHQRRIIARFAHGRVVNLSPRFESLTADTELTTRPTMPLSEVAAMYEAARAESQRSPTAKMRRDAHRNFLLAVLGKDTPISAVSRADALRVKEALSRWPANCTKRFPKLRVDEVLALTPEKAEPTLSATTANAYLQTLTAMFELAAQAQLITSNPCKGLRFRGGGHSEADRLPFDPADLQAIFSAPIYSGCVDDADNYAKAGAARPRRSRFWIPLVALWTGLRLNEICLLREDDVEEIAGIWVIHVRADDPEKTQKTPSSLRLVPVHSELRKLGFIEYAAARREAGGPRSRLFPDLPTATKGYASNNFSRWFGRFLDSLGIDDPKKTFHSFRHTFRDAMIVGGVAPEIRDRMGGWAPTTTGQKYGGSAEVKAKTYAPEIAKVSYSTLSLDHLYSSASAAYRPRPNAARRMTSGS